VEGTDDEARASPASIGFSNAEPRWADLCPDSASEEFELEGLGMITTLVEGDMGVLAWYPPPL
jgi:hypothetical protein